MVSCYWQTHEANMPKKKLCFFPPISKQIMPPIPENIQTHKLGSRSHQNPNFIYKVMKKNSRDNHIQAQRATTKCYRRPPLTGSKWWQQRICFFTAHTQHTYKIVYVIPSGQQIWMKMRQPATFQAKTQPPQSPGENHHLLVMHIDQPQMVVATKNALLKRERLVPTTPTLWKLQAAAKPRGVQLQLSKLEAI